jgi:hypothetical protein
MDLQYVLDMRKTVDEMKLKLTPYSGKTEHQRYYDTLNHYRKIVCKFCAKWTMDIDTELTDIAKVLICYGIDNNKIKAQIENGQ